MSKKVIKICVLIFVVLALTIGIGIIALNKQNTGSNININTEITANEILENRLENYENYDEGIASSILPIVQINTIATENSTIDGKIPSYYNPVIPKGFKAVNSSVDSTIDIKANWGEQDSYLNGLVIEDAKGNQFVWIPVENMEIFKTTDWSKNEATNTIDPTYIEPTEEIKEEYYKMYYKVKKYGGFYIGRYETGDADVQVARTETRNSDNMAIKRNLIPYNYVPFKKTIINQREITGAYELGKKFGQNNLYETVATSAVYGVQWDCMLRFVKSEKNNVNDSLTWGNYPVSELEVDIGNGNVYKKTIKDVVLFTTGCSEQTKAKNIYDIAGNLAEWTMEVAKGNTGIARGGAYVSTIGQLASSRYAYNTNFAGDYVGFRISMYIN